MASNLGERSASATSSAVDIRVLGPLVVEAGAGLVDLGGGQPRAVLAALVVRHPAAVSSDQLIEAVWAGSPPPGAASTLRSYVSVLRRAMEPGRVRGAASTVVRTTPLGYALDVPPDAIDANRFEALVSDGRRARGDGDTAMAIQCFRAAIGLWRGEPYQDFAYADFVRAEAHRLEELRLGCLEDLFDLELSHGRHTDIVGEVEAHSIQHPLRERALGLRMLALYRCGRQADALRAYEDGRRRLVEELGVDPSPALQRRYESILHHHDDLVVVEPGAAAPTAAKRRTLTFLFGDVEGSTEKLRELGDAYSDELERHRKTVGEAVRSHGGRELRMWGDGFFATFDSATDAVSAAVVAQRSIGDGGHSFASRMGVHSGDATWVNGEYVGLAIHVAARIHEVGHGGQVLVSQATKDLIEGDEHAAVDLVDLGSYELKDVPDAVHLYQAASGALPREFPPLRARPARRHNLATPATTFIGREDDLAELETALMPGNVVTLTGVGGVGKTRLAVEAGARMASRFTDGVWLCELATVGSVDELVHAVAAVLGVQRAAGRSLRESVLTALHDRDVLVILDNCEHLLGPVADLVDDVTRSGSGVALLATSREPLGAEGERVWPVRSLALPDGDDASPAAAVRLFEDRARAVRPAFVVCADNRGAVVDICRRLDGIPLAVELAAARVGSMSVAQISERLRNDLRLLRSGRRGAVDRHRTLHAAIDWSYSLLGQSEQRLFDRLSVFSGGFTLEAAESVCAPADEIDVLETLDGLVAKSMVIADVDGPEARYSLLETMRQFAYDRLIHDGEIDRALRAHAEHYAARAQQMATLRFTADERDADRWFDAEQDNLRAAVGWAVTEGDLDLVVRLVEATFTVVRRGPADLYDWAASALRMPGAESHPMRTFLLMVAAEGSWLGGDLAGAEQLALEAVDLLEDPGDIRRVFGLIALGIVRIFQGRLDEARDLCHEARELTVSAEGPAGTAEAGLWGIPATRRFAPYQIDSMLALAEAYGGNTDTALRLVEGVERAAVESGSPALRMAVLYTRGEALLEVDPDRALEALEACVDLCRELGYRFHFGVSLNSAASLRARHGDPARALRLFRELIEHWRTAGNRLQQWTALRNLVELLARIGAAEDAVVLLAAADASPTAGPLYGAHAERLAHIERQLEALLGDGALAAARERGRRLSDAEAVSHAIDAIGRALELTAHAG